MNLKLISLFITLLNIIYFVQSQNVNCDQSSLDIILVIDASGSVGAANYQKAKDAAVSMVQNLNIGPTKVKVGIINYSSTVETVGSLVETDQVKNYLIDKIKNLVYLSGGTASGDALNAANAMFKKFGRTLTPRVVVLFTDGYSNTGSDVYIAAETLRKTKVSIFAIGIGSGINRNELDKISDKPTSTYVQMVSDYSALYAAINEITKVTCETPAFIEPDVKSTIVTVKDEIKRLQLDFTGLSRSTHDFASVDIDIRKGDTKVDVSWLQNGQRSAEETIQLKRRLNENGKFSLFQLFAIPPKAERMYLKLTGLQTDNIYDFEVSLI